MARGTKKAVVPSLPLYAGNWRGRLPMPVQKLFQLLYNITHSDLVMLTIVLLTLVILYIGDMKDRYAPKEHDRGITIFIFISFVIFSTEIILNIFVARDYFMSFFFFLDSITTFSLIPEIDWIWYPVVGLEAGDAEIDTDVDTAFELDRIVRVSDASESLLQFITVVKLLRLGRIAKLFEVSQKKIEELLAERKRKQTSQQFGEEALVTSQYAQPSQLGQHLAEKTTRKVVVLVLIMLIVLPYLQTAHDERTHEYHISQSAMMASSPLLLSNVTAFLDSDGNYQVISNRTSWSLTPESLSATPVVFTRDYLNELLSDYSSTLGQALPDGDKYSLGSPSLNLTHVEELLRRKGLPELKNVVTYVLQMAQNNMDKQFFHIHEYYDTLLYLRLRGKWYNNDWLDERLFDLRPSVMKAVEEGRCLAVFDQTPDIHNEADLTIIRISVVLALLTLAAVSFNIHNRLMIIEPVERMMSTIVALQKNPLAKASLSTIDRDGEQNLADGGKTKHSTDNETGMLERTLEKLTGLLQVGFGGAGSKMISKCLSLTGDGDLDPLVNGSRMLSIFGFCDIRRFTDATECLREEVMMYVNEIAAIVHSNVSMMDGLPNKNVGDAFLLAWPLPDELSADDLFQLTEEQPIPGPAFVIVGNEAPTVDNDANIAPTAAATSPTAASSSSALAPASSSSSSVALPAQVSGMPAGGWVIGETYQRRTQLLQMSTDAERQYGLELDAQVASSELLARARKCGAASPPIVRHIPSALRQHLSVLADKALVSFIRIHVELAASAEVAQFAAHPRIQEVHDDFVVSLGFGLHVGWAIEGPIGSKHKIDASYLSPHVNLSEAIQDLTKQYGVPILISGEFYALLSPYLQSHCRRLDVVKLAGREEPLNLYGVDVHPSALRAIVDEEIPVGYDADADVVVIHLKGRTRHAANGQHEPPPPTIEPSTTPIAGRRIQSRMSRAHQKSRAARVDLKTEASNGAAAASDLRALMRNEFLRVTTTLTDGNGNGNGSAQAGERTHIDHYSLRVDGSRRVGVSGAMRTLIHSSSPIAGYHLVNNFRLSVLTAGIPTAFFDAYAAGLEYYLIGEWRLADRHFAVASELYPEDATTQMMRERIRDNKMHAPPNWTGATDV